MEAQEKVENMTDAEIDDFFDDLETEKKRNILNMIAGLGGLPCLFGIADVCPCNWQCLGGGSCCIA